MDDYNKQAKSDINLKKGRTVEVIEKRECGKCIIFTFDFEMGRLLQGNTDYLEAKRNKDKYTRHSQTI